MHPCSRALRASAALLAVVAVAAAPAPASAASTTPAQEESGGTTDYSALLQRVRSDPSTIQRVVFDPDRRAVMAVTGGGNKLVSYYPTDASALRLQELLEKDGIDFSATPAGSGGSGGLASWGVLLWLFPLVLLAGLFVVGRRRQQQAGGRTTSKMLELGKSKARRVKPSTPATTFADVAGVDETVEDLQEIKEYLKDPRRFTRLGARMPRGVLLHGPPGTGKTLLARAVAGEAGVPFFFLSGSDFVEVFVGVGASRVRDMFREAKASAPSIVFIDEIDAVGRHRSGGGMSNDEREQTLNQLLTEIDGFEPSASVVVMAATNRPDILDSALLRPGRFDRQIQVSPPDRTGRREILAIHARGKLLDSTVDLDRLAAQTAGFTGADLERLLNEGALLATRRRLSAIGEQELEEAILRVIAGPEKKHALLSGEERSITAYHEIGHALVGYLLPACDLVQRVSIVRRGDALGLTLSLPDEDHYLRRRSALLERMAMTLAGREAEKLIFGEVSSGAANDLERASRTARAMVTRLGMSAKLGPRAVGGADEPGGDRLPFGLAPAYSEALARQIDLEIAAVLGEAERLAADLLRSHEGDLHRLAAALIEHETIDRGELERLLGVLPAAFPAAASSPQQPDVPAAEPKPGRVPEGARAGLPELGVDRAPGRG